MSEDIQHHDLEDAISEVLSARSALMQVVTNLYGTRDTGATYAYFLKDDESTRVRFTEWLKTMNHISGSSREKASAYIITALYAPTLSTLAASFATEQKKPYSQTDLQADMQERWDTATAYVSTWKLIEMHLRERFAALPEGAVKQHVAPQVAHISESFKTVLPPESRIH